MSLLAACTSPSLSLDDQPPEKNLSFTILHTNDIHAHDDSFTEEGKAIGGIPRIAHIIKTAKAKNDNVLAIDAGDIFQGTPYFEQYHGKAEIESLNKAGYDIYTIGNHEFDDGATNLGKQLALARFAVLNCNLDFAGHSDLASIVKPSIVKTIGGQKVGFIGVITPELSALSTKLEGVKVKSVGSYWMEPVKAEVEKLKAEGINKIIVVSHSGIEFEKALAQQVPDIDVIVGGHSHTRLEHPVIIEHPDGSRCYVVQTGCYTRALGRLELSFDAAGKIIAPKTTYHLINLTERIFEDPEVKSFVTEMSKPFAYLRSTIVGGATATFDNKFKTYPFDSPIGDLVCDALLYVGSQHGATISMQNRGGIRGRLEQGAVSLETIKEILPFENHLIVATINGAVLIKALENSVSGILGGRFLDVKGVKFAYDISRESGRRIVFAIAQDNEGNWGPITSDGLYRVAVNSFTYSGGEGYDFSSARDVVDTGKRLSTVLQEYLEKKKTVSPQPPSRFLAVSGNLTSINESTLKISNKDAAGASVTVLTGSAPGVTFVPKVGITPLNDPLVAGTGKLDQEGQFEFNLTPALKRSSKPQKTGTAGQGERAQWGCAVILTKDSAHRRIITEPIRIAN